MEDIASKAITVFRDTKRFHNALLRLRTSINIWRIRSLASSFEPLLSRTTVASALFFSKGI
jgi:hypothetical protein